MDETTAGAGVVPVSRRKGLIVLGMHRSGTSVLTNILGELGFHVGDTAELTAANWENPKGFFERRDMRALCDRMLHAAGADWWKVSDFNPARLGPEFLTAALTEFRGIVAGLDARGRWATKEPRLCILFPLLAAVLTEPAVVVTVRHPLEVAKSLRRRNGIPTVAGLALWEVYTCSALRASAHLPRSIVLHHELLADPAGSVDALQRELGVMGFALSPRGVPARVVDPGLKRSTIEGKDPDAALSAHQRALWDALCRRAPLDEALLTVPEPSRDILREFEADEAERLDRVAALKKTRQDYAVAAKELERARERLDEFGRQQLAAAAARAALEEVVTLGRARQASLMDDLEQAHRARAAASAEIVELHRREEDHERRHAAARLQADHLAAVDQQNRTKAKRITRLEQENGMAETLLQQAFFADRREARRVLRYTFARARYRLLQDGLHRWLPTAARNRRDERILKDSIFFRPQWYAQKYLGPRSKMSPLAHFVVHGWRRGNNPSPYFDTTWYLTQHLEIAGRDLNPLVHFLKVGGRMGALPSPNASLLACVRNTPRKRRIPLDVADMLAEQIRTRQRLGKKRVAKEDEGLPAERGGSERAQGETDNTGGAQSEAQSFAD